MNMKTKKFPTQWIWPGAILLVIVIGFLTKDRWILATKAWVGESVDSFRDGKPGEEDSHAGHDHGGHEGHNEATSLELSAQALRNIGLSAETIQPIKLVTFRKSITVPALVVERPGRSRVQVATPMTGVITHVHAVEGEAVEPGTLLFQIRLTHEDLVLAQTGFLRMLGELDVEDREITRLTEVVKSGAVPGTLLLERQYSKDKLVVQIRAQREALRLHGLSDQQIDTIAAKRRLLRELQIFAPAIDSHLDGELKLTENEISPVAFSQDDKTDTKVKQDHTGPLILQDLNIHKGQSVVAGETLCVLTDYDKLFIEGLSFEQDVEELRKASENEWKVDGIFDESGGGVRVVEGLEIAYLANQVDLNSRTLRFYVHLPNELTKDRRADGNRYVEWRYLPGQRLQLRVPVAEWHDQIVLPVEAVAREGAEYFIFQQNGSHFDRVPVHVKYRDQYSAVIDNDGSLFPGDVVAMGGAHQMQMALKNKAGGGVDPHAGHNH